MSVWLHVSESETKPNATKFLISRGPGCSGKAIMVNELCFPCAGKCVRKMIPFDGCCESVDHSIVL